VHAGAPSEDAAGGDHVAPGDVQPERGGCFGQRQIGRVGGVRGARRLLQDDGVVVVQEVQHAQHPAVVGVRLAVRSEGHRTSGARQPDPGEHVEVVDGVGVVDLPGRVVAALRQHREDRAVVAPCGDEGHRVEHGATGELVAEGHRTEAHHDQSGALGGFCVCRPTRADLVEQARLGLTGHDGEQVEELTGRRRLTRDASRDGEADQGWHGRSAAQGGELGDEERVAAARRHHRRRHVRADDRRHGCLGQRLEVHAPGPFGRQAAEEPIEPAGVVRLGAAPREHHERGQAAQAAAHDREQIEGGVVGPVEVLDDQHGGTAGAGELRQDRLLEGDLIT
jgi:hypothetical protein